MTTTKTLLERVQSLPIHLIREIKERLDPETQIDLLKSKPSVYVNINKTIRNQYVKTYLKEPSMHALYRGLNKDKTKITHKIWDSMGESKYQTYYVNCELPGHVVAKMYETNIHKPMVKALKRSVKDAPMVFDLDGKMKPCITPLERSIVARFKTMSAPIEPTYTNERTKMRYTRALNDYHNSLPDKVHSLLEDFDNCASFITDLDYAIRMSSLRFLKALAVLSKQYVQSPVNDLLNKRTAEDIQIDKNREAYYAKNIEIANMEREQRDMLRESGRMFCLMREEAKIREQHAKEQRKLAREEAKSRKLQEKEEKMRLREERANKKAQVDQEKALRAVFREQTRANKIAEKKQKDAELVEKYTFKTIRTMFV